MFEFFVLATTVKVPSQWHSEVLFDKPSKLWPVLLPYFYLSPFLGPFLPFVLHTLPTPNCANYVRDNSTTVLGVAETVGKAFIHFEWESTTTGIIFPWNGPAKSMCSLTQGLDCHFHGCSGATRGADCCSWQWQHACTEFLMSLLRHSHQTYILASDFIFVIRGCPSQRSCRTAFLHPTTDSDLFLELYAESDLSLGHPHSTNCRTLDSTRSLLVQTLMWHVTSKCSINSTSSGGVCDVSQAYSVCPHSCEHLYSWKRWYTHKLTAAVTNSRSEQRLVLK